MAGRFSNTPAAFALDVSAVAAGYGVLVAVAVIIGGAALSPIAPLEFSKAVGWDWPEWWGYTIVAVVVCVGSIIAGNPFRRVASYGDSRPATKREAKKMGLLAPRGIILGKAWGRYIRFDEALSLLVLAPPGTGKSAAIAIPTLLSAGRSFVVNDVKGELYATTANVRRHYGRVVRFAPAESGSAKWNPLSELPASWPARITLVERIASRLYPIKDEGSSDGDYFTREARALFVFYALWLLWKEDAASLPRIRSIAMSTDDVQAWIAEALDEGGDEVPQRVREEGNGMLQKGGREFGSVLGSFKAGLAAFADPIVAENTDGDCDFSATALREELTTVYVTVSPEDISRLAPLIRVLVEQLADQLLSLPWNKKKEQQVTFLLDEMPRLGKLETIINMPALSRSYGVNAMMIAQDYAQIEEFYGRTGIEKVDGTTEYHVIFQQSNQKTAEAYSKKIGTTTRIKVGRSRSSSLKSGGGSKSENDEGVPLLLPQEITDLGEFDAIILRKGNFTRPIFAKQARWYLDTNMLGLHARAEKEAKTGA